MKKVTSWTSTATTARWFPIFMAALVFTACSSTQTPYTPAESETGFGYRESALTENRYRVAFAGNSLTSSDKVQDYTLLRAAELTVQKGYDWFTVSNRDTAEEHDTFGPGATVSYGTVPMMETRCGLLTCTSRYSEFGVGTSVHMPARDRKRYTSRIEILMGSGAPDKPEEAYDAHQLIATLRNRL